MAGAGDEDSKAEDSPPSMTPPTTGSGTVRVVDSQRTVVVPEGATRTGHKALIDLPPRDEYWLDYTVTFEPGFYFTAAGKLPGLAGGKATTGCSDIDPQGWSARLGWSKNGVGNLYIYDQNRDSSCGDDNYFPELRYQTGRTHRLTQWLKINTPGERNGATRVWLDGELAVKADAMEFRGDVDASQARVDRIAYSVFSGGKDPSVFAPPTDQAIRFSDMRILTCPPDFSVSPTRCAN